jgi:glycosyltransferase involved in cell wall biosynthesis
VEGNVPRISVVIPCLNGAADIPGQLGALAAQTWPGWWEVVVADNGSTDGSADVVMEFADWLPRVRVVDASQRRGGAYATNTGMRMAEGDAVCLLDADDEAAPGYLEAMAAALEQHDLVAASYDSETLNDAAVVQARGTPQRDHLLNAYGFLPYAGSGGLAFQREVLERIGDFDEQLLWLFDVDFCWRAQGRGIPITFVPNAVVRIRFRADPAALYRQERNWASVEPLLYRRYRQAGMPRSSLRAAARGWARAVVRLPELRDPERDAHYLRLFGQRVGRLRGSLRQRVVFL